MQSPANSRRKKYHDVVVYKGYENTLPWPIPVDPHPNAVPDPHRVLRQSLRHVLCHASIYPLLKLPETVAVFYDAFWWIWLEFLALEDHSTLRETYRVLSEKAEQLRVEQQQLSGAPLPVENTNDFLRGTGKKESVPLAPTRPALAPHLRGRSFRTLVLTSRPVPKEAGARAPRLSDFETTTSSTPRSARSTASSMTWYSLPSQDGDDPTTPFSTLSPEPTPTQVLNNFDAGGGVYRGVVTTEGVQALMAAWEVPGENHTPEAAFRLIRLEQRRLYSHMAENYVKLFRNLPRAKREKLFPKLPDILAVAVTQTLWRTMPYLRDRFTTRMRSNVKKRLTYWILGFENGDVAKWEDTENKIKVTQTKTSSSHGAIAGGDLISGEKKPQHSIPSANVEDLKAVNHWKTLQSLAHTHVKNAALATTTVSVLASAQLIVDSKVQEEIENLRTTLYSITRRGGQGKPTSTVVPTTPTEDALPPIPRKTRTERLALRHTRLSEELSHGRRLACWYETGRSQAVLVPNRSVTKSYFALTFCSPLFRCYLDETGYAGNQIIHHRDLSWET